MSETYVSAPLKPTATERAQITDAMFSERVTVTVWLNVDETWGCEVGGVVFEGHNPIEIFAELYELSRAI